MRLRSLPRAVRKGSGSQLRGGASPGQQAFSERPQMIGLRVGQDMDPVRLDVQGPGEQLFSAFPGQARPTTPPGFRAGVRENRAENWHQFGGDPVWRYRGLPGQRDPGCLQEHGSPAEDDLHAVHAHPHQGTGKCVAGRQGLRGLFPERCRKSIEDHGVDTVLAHGVQPPGQVFPAHGHRQAGIPALGGGALLDQGVVAVLHREGDAEIQ